ncbi:DNA polymerase III, subunit gamma/tau [Synechococcus sp. PCC 7502]|uniref:DNA polymerase III subunit gamma/tau n=1 Tax=Synechococcus sp. PCC 7502 TaxID=1173263 RepID=UPI00029FE6B7|nr:DNA polymerase III subunit gamma/tau [Synechococcus sp. PCC 7502]AFY75230.1 DNA polymerase III, subunit gamma/tau [Synechococcus sp. PCC 7502]
MAYEPLHHKYRPQTFADLVGQEAIATTLSNAMKTQRIAPAYLLTGARGTGKTSTARIMAKSLNCLSFDVPTATPCGKCEMCLSIIRGNALDITEIDAASNTGVENIRDLIERSQFAPVQARYKVYAIDECHMLSTSAFNALLKTLEEPPDRVVFILATTDPQRVLPTIISRCQRFDFRRIPLEPMVQHLTQIAQIENININPEALLLVAQMAQGGLRDAESLLDQLSLHVGEIKNETVWDLVGTVPERDLLEILEAIALQNSVAVIEKIRQIMDRGREPLTVLQSLGGFYRDLLIAKTAGDRQDLVALTAGTWAKLNQIAQEFPLESILLGQQHLRSAEVQIKNTTQPRLWLEITLIGLFNQVGLSHQSITSNVSVLTSKTPALTPIQNPSSTISNIAPSEPPTTATQVPSANILIPTFSSESNESSISSYQDLAIAWQELIRYLSPPSKAIFVNKAIFLEINHDHVVIGLKDKGLREIAIKKREELEKCSKQVFKRPMQVKFRFVTSETETQKSSLSPSPTSAPTPIAPTTPVENPQIPESNLAITNLPKSNPSPKTEEKINENENISPQPDLSAPRSPQASEAIKNVVTFFDGQLINLN